MFLVFYEAEKPNIRIDAYFCCYAQTKFIKEYSYYSVVDSSSYNLSIEKIVENSNDILKQGDQDNYGIRIKYEGVLDTLEFKDTLEAKIILKHLKDNYDKKRVVYITKSVLIKEDTTAHGVAYKPGTKFVVQYNSDYDKTAFIFSHEFLHNLGLSHSKETKNIFGMLVQSDLMSPNPLILTGNMSVRTKEDLWEQLIRSSQFYEFRPVDEK